MPSGNVEIEILDGGAGVVSVAAASVQLVIGTSSDGDAATIVATRSPKTLASTFGTGQLPEAAALVVKKGGTALAMKAETVAEGDVTAVTMTRDQVAETESTVVVTVTGDPNDEYYVSFLVTTSGTRGTAGIKFKLSLDAGRNYGPNISLGTAVSYAIPGTGLTLVFAAGTLNAGDVATFSTTPPTWDSGSVQACIAAFQASQYATAGIGSAHLVGVTDGADAATFGSDLDDLAEGFVFTRMITAARDSYVPIAWGGAGETEATWIASLATEYSAVSAKRLLSAAGCYNMPSAFPTDASGSPRYRRNLAWALACRQVQIAPQRHAGRVKDGGLANISVDPTSDPSDGFVYHDERVTVGLDEARFCSARTRMGKQGIFIVQPNLMAPDGSVFSLLPYGNVMDIACSITQQVGSDEINDDLQLNDSGTIHENEAQRIEAVLRGAINANMTAKKMISSVSVVVDRDNNILATDEVNIAVTIVRRGYILQENVTIGFKNPFAA